MARGGSGEQIGMLDQFFAARRCLDALEVKGLSVEAVTGSQDILRVLEDLGKPYLTPAMSPRFNDFTSQNCFWLVLSRQEERVAAVAARLVELGEMAIDEYWRRSMRRYYGEGQRPQIGIVSGIASGVIRGSVVYFGDLIVKKADRGSRMTLHVMAVLAQALAHAKWRADWHYAFISDRDLRRTGQLVYGFYRMDPYAQEWLDPPPTRGSHECCIYSSRAEVEDLLAKAPFQLSI